MPFDSGDYVASGTFWFTLSLINAGLAQSKMRSGLNWWLASLLAGPLATLLLVISPRADSAAPGAELSPRQIGLIAGIVILVAVGLFAFVNFANGP